MLKHYEQYYNKLLVLLLLSIMVKYWVNVFVYNMRGMYIDNRISSFNGDFGFDYIL